MITDLGPYSAYRDSGVEWLGKVPEEWKILLARRFCRVFAGATPSRDESSYWDEGEIPWLASGDVNQRRIAAANQFITQAGFQASSTKWIRPGSIVIALAGQGKTKGMAALVDMSATCNQSLGVLEPDPTLCNSEFLLYYLESRYLDIRGLVGDLRDGLNLEHLKQLPVPIPPLTRQDEIVRILNYVEARIQRLIKAKEALIELAEEDRQATIHHAVTRGLEPAVSLKPSGVDWLGQIPDHWEIVALKRAVHRIIDCEHKTAPAVASSDFRVIRTSAVRGGRFLEAGTYCTDSEAFEEWTRRGAPVPGDVLLTREAPAGEACVVPAEGAYCLGQRMVLLKPDLSRCPAQFLVFSIYGGAIRQEIENASRGSTVAHFNVDDIGRLPLALPPVEEARKIADLTSAHLAETDQAIAKTQRYISLLREYGARLNSDVVTGKLDVREAAANLPSDSDADDPALDERLEEVAAA